MEARLNGVFDPSCNGTVVRGSSSLPHAHCNCLVNNVICAFAVSRIRLLVTGATCYRILGINALRLACIFPPFRLSIRGTDHFSPFPFSGTHYVLRNNVFRRRNPTGQLYLVCKLCWIHVRHVSTLFEPCGGCDF